MTYVTPQVHEDNTKVRRNPLKNIPANTEQAKLEAKNKTIYCVSDWMICFAIFLNIDLCAYNSKCVACVRVPLIFSGK